MNQLRTGHNQLFSTLWTVAVFSNWLCVLHREAVLMRVRSTLPIGRRPYFFTSLQTTHPHDVSSGFPQSKRRASYEHTKWMLKTILYPHLARVTCQHFFIILLTASQEWRQVHDHRENFCLQTADRWIATMSQNYSIKPTSSYQSS